MTEFHTDAVGRVVKILKYHDAQDITRRTDKSMMHIVEGPIAGTCRDCGVECEGKAE